MLVWKARNEPSSLDRKRMSGRAWSWVEVARIGRAVVPEKSLAIRRHALSATLGRFTIFSIHLSQYEKYCSAAGRRYFKKYNFFYTTVL
ncbi:hypothetical protein BAR24066_02196 [Burkholderia arboris]|uniref:Uncharacterized protein n=1 Tax=Burkholderia arboris TaxID=488730 RepID=A0A9Q9UQR6_9BURK|nr:hypothetical protein BAR24066_02196 [Burkholderia arboris]